MIARPAVQEAVFEALPPEIIVHDLEFIVLANAASCRSFGAASPRSLVGLPITTLIHPEAIEAGRERRHAMFANGHAFARVQLRLLKLNGDEFTTDVSARRFFISQEAYGLVIGSAVVGNALAEEAAAEQAPSFEDGTPLAHAVLDSLPQPVLAIAEDDTILFANRAASRVFAPNEPSAEFVGRHVQDVIHPHGRAAAAERRRMVREYGHTFPRVAAKAQSLDGQPLHVCATVALARPSDHSRVICWFGHSVERG